MLLRLQGESLATIPERLMALRPVTALQVGEEHIRAAVRQVDDLIGRGGGGEPST